MSDAEKDDKVLGLVDLIDITKFLLDYRNEHGAANFEQALKGVKVQELISVFSLSVVCKLTRLS